MQVIADLGQIFDVMRAPYLWKARVKDRILTFHKRPSMCEWTGKKWRWTGTHEEFVEAGGCQICNSLPPGMHSQGVLLCPKG